LELLEYGIHFPKSNSKTVLLVINRILTNKLFYYHLKATPFTDTSKDCGEPKACHHLKPNAMTNLIRPKAGNGGNGGKAGSGGKTGQMLSKIIFHFVCQSLKRFQKFSKCMTS
jgi:hypothetical protein